MRSTEEKTVLILGCGYLGRRVAEEALERGYAVKAVSRNMDTLESVASLGAEIFQGRIEEDGWHRFAGESVDLAVNCVSSAGGGLEGYRVSYIEGNRSLAAWAEAARFRGRAIYTSSVSVYPDVDGAWVSEADGERPSNERGKLVRESEQVFLEGLAAARPVALRLAGLYGPGRSLLLRSAREGAEELSGWGDYYLNLVRIEDVASAVWAAADADVTAPVFNVVDDAPSLKAEMVAWLASELGHPTPRFSGKAPESGRGSRRMGGGGRPSNRRVSNAALKEATGWRPRYPSFREGFGELMGRGDRD